MVYKQVFIINSDLGMSKGKIAVQTAHAEVLYMEEIPEDEKLYERFIIWRKEEHGLMKKAVLKATEEEMNKIVCDMAVKEIDIFSVYDRGLTQIDPNSFTCLVIEPLPEERCDELFGHLKLL